MIARYHLVDKCMLRLAGRAVVDLFSAQPGCLICSWPHACPWRLSMIAACRQTCTGRQGCQKACASRIVAASAYRIAHNQTCMTQLVFRAMHASISEPHAAEQVLHDCHQAAAGKACCCSCQCGLTRLSGNVLGTCLLYSWHADAADSNRPQYCISWSLP